MTPTLTALLLHRIADGTDRPSDIDRGLFTRCLELARASGVPVRTLAESAPARDDAICLTFDDGWESDATVALPALADRALRATFFVTTGHVGAPSFLTWPQVRALAEAGMEVGSHTCSHPDLTRLGPDDLRRELRASREELQGRLGRPVDGLSVPHGSYNRRVLLEAADAGYARVCVSRPGQNSLPLHAGCPLRRNALHRGVGEADLAHLLRPDRGTLLRWQMSYAGRAVLRRVLSDGQYARLRGAATAYLARGRARR